jgi:hypothetical protein
MAPRQLRGDRANCSQLLRISTLLGHWAAELSISQQRSVANQFASNELVSDWPYGHALRNVGGASSRPKLDNGGTARSGATGQL